MVILRPVSVANRCNCSDVIRQSSDSGKEYSFPSVRVTCGYCSTKGTGYINRKDTKGRFQLLSIVFSFSKYKGMISKDEICLKLSNCNRQSHCLPYMHSIRSFSACRGYACAIRRPSYSLHSISMTPIDTSISFSSNIPDMHCSMKTCRCIIY
jgi:hypothetical protein